LTACTSQEVTRQWTGSEVIFSQMGYSIGLKLKINLYYLSFIVAIVTY